jgi:mono/diheme cytochrome c family protein
MKNPVLILLVLALVIVGTAFSTQKPPANSHGDAKDTGKKEGGPSAEHGQYLVHHVAMCIQCHTPRDEHGQLIMSKLLQGDALPVSSPFKDVRWAFRAPHIAGLPGYTKEQAMRLLTTGIAANGMPPLGPMPPFRMSNEDAADVIAYLSTLE